MAAGPAGAAKTVFAKKLTRILPQGKEPVLFEGGAFGPEGNFFFANVLAQPGGPKVISLDPKTKEWKSIHTDKDGVYTSTQFDSQGNLWVTDFAGKIDEMSPDIRRARTRRRSWATSRHRTGSASPRTTRVCGSANTRPSASSC